MQIPLLCAAHAWYVLHGCLHHHRSTQSHVFCRSREKKCLYRFCYITHFYRFQSCFYFPWIRYRLVSFPLSLEVSSISRKAGLANSGTHRSTPTWGSLDFSLPSEAALLGVQSPLTGLLPAAWLCHPTASATEQSATNSTDAPVSRAFLLLPFKFFFGFHQSDYDVTEFTVLGVHWSFWECRWILFVKFGKFSLLF